VVVLYRTWKFQSGHPSFHWTTWTVIAQYNHFLVEHRQLYHQAEPAARIALISAKPHNPLADEFLKQSVFFETNVRA
jgi:hypothetical protein